VRLLKVYTIAATLFGASWLVAFRQQGGSQEFEEVKAKRLLVVDADGKGRIMMASNYKSDGSAGLYFFNRLGTESGALSYDGRRREDGQVETFAVWTMDEFQDDEVVRVGMEQSGSESISYSRRGRIRSLLACNNGSPSVNPRSPRRKPLGLRTTCGCFISGAQRDCSYGR
jgi:hypothetical protein